MKDENGDRVGNQEGRTRIYHWKSIFLAFWLWITFVFSFSKDGRNGWMDIPGVVYF